MAAEEFAYVAADVAVVEILIGVIFVGYQGAGRWLFCSAPRGGGELLGIRGGVYEAIGEFSFAGGGSDGTIFRVLFDESLISVPFHSRI